MPTKVLPSCRAGGGPRRRRHNTQSGQHSHSQTDGRLCQTRRPRFSVASSSNRHQDGLGPKEQLRFKDRQDRSSASSGADSSTEDSYRNLGRIGPNDTSSPIYQRKNQHEYYLSDASSGSEAYFQRQYRSLLSNKKDRRPPRSPLLKKQQSQPSEAQQQRSKSRSMQLCSTHQRQLLLNSGLGAKSGADQSGSQVAYQAALSPLTSSESSEDEARRRINEDNSAYVKRLARLALAKQNINTSNRQQHRQQQSYQQVPPRRNYRYDSPTRVETSARISMRHSASPSPPSPAQQKQQQQQQQPMQQLPLPSRRSNRENRCYSDWDYEENASNREDIYDDDCRRRGSYRQSGQHVRQSAVQSLRRRQQQKPEEQLKPQKKRYQQPKLDESFFDVNDCYRDEANEDACREEDEEAGRIQVSSLQRRIDTSSKRPDNQRSQKCDWDALQSDRPLAISRPRHWCRDGSKLCPTQRRRETLFSCPYVTLSLQAQTFECMECAAVSRKEKCGGRNDKQRYQREVRLDDSDEAAPGWSKNYRF